MKGLILTIIIGIWSSFASAQSVRLSYDSFTVDFDTILRVPSHVFWSLQKSDLGKARRIPSWKFIAESSLGKRSSTSLDYLGSGFDRGHMCPAGDRTSSTSACKATFIMTNVCPQVPSLNRGDWSRDESRTRAFVRGGHHVNIEAHAVYWRADTMWIGRGRVAVPHGFVKTVRLAGNDSIIYSRYYPNN